MDTIKKLFATIKQRQKYRPKESYTAELFKKGTDEITKKIGEEAIEVIIAGKNKDKEEITYEMADLWYHCLVLLAHSDITPEDIYGELEKRFK
ncbi:phosphoribosyl-ATP diphosphatase [Patescibacteria group bacterium]|nr:phosphoribosyl-ATP diphosphatase [Patescibacteria group bacterium]MBU4512112.1 phosphoribosyl-ATP diphosphatase [Patescibacteria group bacterium]MCG2694356.1 phosphoribosyl-ATP diphosphatase [Candidatus Parcubacteria bacterium]